jgi:Protein of unknown function (DUF642)
MNRRNVIASMVMVLATLPYALTGSAQNLIQNGSFEFPRVPIGSYTQFTVGVPPFIPSWTVVTNPGENVLIVSSAYTGGGCSFPAEDQQQWLDLTGAGSNTHTTGVQQAVRLVPGHVYQLSYWVGNITYLGDSPSTVKVSINGTPMFSDTNSMVSPCRLVWQGFTHTFTAGPGPLTTLTFFNGDGPNDNINGLDNISLVDTGYLEICKVSDPNHPVTGLFTFTAINGGFNSGPISVPVGQCSGSIQVPSGAVTVTETPVLGVAVSNVTAYAYDELGFYHDELNSWSQPDLHAIVNVMAGDQDEETLTTFTNYAAPPGLLKLCKVAGDQSTLGQVFTFTVTGGGQRHVYMIQAGPPQQGGNCVLAGNFPVNTQVMIAETPKPPFVPSGITVNEGQLMPCRPPSIYCAVAAVIPGITEVTFTNILGGHSIGMVH